MQKPTNETITSISAASGSSTQPMRKLPAPRSNHARLTKPRPWRTAAASAHSDSNNEPPRAASATRPAVRPARRGRRLVAAAASSGSSGASHRWWVIHGRFIRAGG